MATGQTQGLERELEQLLDQERFEPPDEFREQALLNDPSIYEKANADPQAWWAEQAKALKWFEGPRTGPAAPAPPFYKWFTDGKLNASYNCLDRHIEAGNRGRAALHRRGPGGQEGHRPHADP